ncbi:hypothetical protein [Rhizobium sp. TRM95796]|uniref:hypothetical protein n=1 Tax=Rhizobium sp. TRM95796 TaxID=2979862 RepID=UPI0021E7DEFB|nr:hypothetical protein [Rhizobium sp. TRM95796]MCV3765097.1 hypothetical protein [Rhizobium sp. TRM95796]
MPILQVTDGLAIFRFVLLPAEVPILLERHRTKYSGSADIEEAANRLKAYGFAENASVNFVGDVYNWSRMRRNADRVQKASGFEIAAKLRAASQQIDDGDEPKAIQTLCKIPHLGMSYASKIARFLDPAKCVILDSVIRERIGYPNDIDGYAAFLRDCRDALTLLKASPVLDPCWRETLRVSDVEAAFFMKAKENRNVRPQHS